MSAGHLNVNRASCRRATCRVAGQAPDDLIVHFGRIGYDRPRQRPFRASTPTRRLPRRSTCLRRCPNRMLQLGTAELREPIGSVAAVLMCASALCARWLSPMKYFAFYRGHRGVAPRRRPNSDPIRSAPSHCAASSDAHGSHLYACPGHDQSRVPGR